MDVTNALAGANVLLGATLTDNVLASHRTDASDGAGGTTVAFGTETTIPARVHLDSTASGAPAGSEQLLDTFTIVTTTAAGVREGDRIRWVDNTGTTRTMFVVEVKDSSWLVGSYATAVEAP